MWLSREWLHAGGSGLSPVWRAYDVRAADRRWTRRGGRVSDAVRSSIEFDINKTLGQPIMADRSRLRRACGEFSPDPKLDAYKGAGASCLRRGGRRDAFGAGMSRNYTWRLQHGGGRRQSQTGSPIRANPGRPSPGTNSPSPARPGTPRRRANSPGLAHARGASAPRARAMRNPARP